MRGDEAATMKQSFQDKCVPKLELGNEGISINGAGFLKVTF